MTSPLAPAVQIAGLEHLDERYVRAVELLHQVHAAGVAEDGAARRFGQR